MNNSDNEKAYDVYRDIQARTNGDIYIGVVGPVRCGKSTFIKRFMELWVIPNIEDVHSKQRAIDELPQSANGRSIMTTEPKFVPKEAANIILSDDISLNIRLIDCVGYMVDGASGHLENDQERMVKTPWFDHEIPFVKAAETGTKKVITDHSTIGIVITSDGSFGEIEREAYIDAETKTITELKTLNKPFIVLLNSDKPFSNETKELANKIAIDNGVKVLPINCEQLKKQDIVKIMEELVSVFPIEELCFYSNRWIDMLDILHPIKAAILNSAKQLLSNLKTISDAKESISISPEDNDIISKIKIDKIDMKTGSIHIYIEVDDSLYYKTITELTGVHINNEYQLIQTIRELTEKKTEYDKVENACINVKTTGYSVVTPDIGEIKIEDPEIIRHGGKYGVKIKASAPSTHMLLANISVEIAPIVGSEEQANDLIRYIQDNSKTNPTGIWDTNIFGKSIRQLIDEGIYSKVNKMNEETKGKMRETLQKIINESSGGVICIII